VGSTRGICDKGQHKEETKVYPYTVADLVWALAREREEEARQTRPHSDGKSAARSG